MSDYTLYPKVTVDGTMPPKVLERLDERYLNAGELDDPTDSTVNAKDLGVTAGTSTSQSAKLQAAMEQTAAAGQVLRLPPGAYRLDSSIGLPGGLRLDATGAILDFAACRDPYYLRIQGTTSPTLSYSATILKGAYTVSLANHGLTTGAWCMIRSQDVVDPDSTGVTCGELIQVRAVNADQVTFLTPVCDTYSTGVTIMPVQMVRDVQLTGGTIRGNRVAADGRGGLRAQFCEGLRLRGVRFEGIDDVHCFMRDCVDAWAFDCVFEWAESNAMGYAFSLGDTSRDSGCCYSTFKGVRHTLSTNNTTAAGAGGIVRRILFAFNRVEYTTTAISGSQLGGDAIDTHTAAEDIWILYNSVRGSSGNGINLECISGRIEGNTIRNSAYAGINVHNESRRTGSIIISGNRVAGSGGHGINVRHGTRGTPAVYESAIITDNAVSDTGDVGLLVGYTNYDRGTIVTGNTVRGTKNQGIQVRRQEGAIVHSNRVIGGANGITYDNVRYSVLGPNSVDAGTPTGAWVGETLTNVSYCTLTPGAVKADVVGGVGMSITSSCSRISLGKTGHINAPTPLVNDAGSTVS